MTKFCALNILYYVRTYMVRSYFCLAAQLPTLIFYPAANLHHQNKIMDL